MAEHSGGHVSAELLGIAVLAGHHHPFQTGVPSRSPEPGSSALRSCRAAMTSRGHFSSVPSISPSDTCAGGRDFNTKPAVVVLLSFQNHRIFCGMSRTCEKHLPDMPGLRRCRVAGLVQRWDVKSILNYLPSRSGPVSHPVHLSL